MAPALNYAEQAFEGVKAFRTPDDQIAIFRTMANAKRLAHSTEYVAIPPVPEAHFIKCCHLAVGFNAEWVPPHHTGAAMYIRPLVFGSSAHLALAPPDEYTFVVYVMPVGVFHGVHAVDALILEEFDRAAPEGTGSAKLGGNYGPVLKWSERAKNDGFGITLHLDSKTKTEVDEFSTSAFVGVHKRGENYTVVVPDSRSVIKSVTSDSVCEIAKWFGWNVECRSIKYDEISTFTEVMAAGTAAALVPVKSITMRSRNDKFTYQGGSDDPGPVCKKLLTTLKSIQLGKTKDLFGWLDYVKEPQEVPSTNGASTDEVNDRVDELP